MNRIAAANPAAERIPPSSGFIHAPDVLIFDEPLTGLDPLGIRRMKESITKRAQDGASVVLSVRRFVGIFKALPFAPSRRPARARRVCAAA